MQMSRVLTVTAVCLAVVLAPPGVSALYVKRPIQKMSVLGIDALTFCQEGEVCAFQTYEHHPELPIHYYSRCICGKQMECVPSYNNLRTSVINLRCKRDSAYTA